MDNYYCHKQGWLDGYSNRAINPYRLGDPTLENIENYNEGWEKGQQALSIDISHNSTTDIDFHEEFFDIVERQEEEPEF